MSVDIAEIIVLVLGGYFAIGLLFAIAFVIFGAKRIDPAARTMPLQARLMILPGTLLLWPLMAWKWRTQTEPPLQ